MLINKYSNQQLEWNGYSEKTFRFFTKRKLHFEFPNLLFLFHLLLSFVLQEARCFSIFYEYFWLSQLGSKCKLALECWRAIRPNPLWYQFSLPGGGGCLWSHSCRITVSFQIIVWLSGWRQVVFNISLQIHLIKSHRLLFSPAPPPTFSLRESWC